MRPGFIRRNRQLPAAIAFVAPWLVGLGALVAYPFGASLYWSFCSYDLLSPPRFVGAVHYRRLAQEMIAGERFGQAVFNTGYFALVSVPLSIVLGVGLALMLSANVRGRSVYRTLLFLPSVVPVVAASVLWMWLLDPRDGLVNQVLMGVGLPAPAWFNSPRTVAWPPEWLRGTAGLGSKDALTLLSLWGVGNFMVIYLAALGDIPVQYYEAAQLDGAGPLRRMWHTTMPLLTPVIFFNLVMGLIQAVQAFTQVYLVSEGRGEPAGSTLMISLHLFLAAFRDLDMGYASAIAWVLFVFVLILTAGLFRWSRTWVYYRSA